jgi:hypothetical protein
MWLNSLVDSPIWYACVHVHFESLFKKLSLHSSFQPFGSINKEHGELLRWLADTRQRLTHVIEAPITDFQAEYKVTTLSLCLSLCM